MDLGLDILRTTGRPKAKLEGEVVKTLTGADLALLELDRGVKPPALKRLRDAHHSIARMVASGLKGHEISAATGYTQSRISILKGDPSFQELIAFYKAQNDGATAEAFADAQMKLAAVNSDAIEVLHDRLLDEPESIATEDILNIVKVTSDRTGNGPQSKSTNVNFNVDLAARVAAGRERAKLVNPGPGLPGGQVEGAGASPPLLAPSKPGSG